MIKKMRRNFILITMLSVVLVLTVIMAIVNGINFAQKDRSASQMLTMLADNKGQFPFKNPQKKPGDGKPFAFSPEAPYETRYFSVQLKENGELVSVDTGKIAAVDTEQAASFAQTLWQKGKRTGYLGNYKYLAQENNAGVRFLFLDCTRDLNSVREFLWISLVVSGIGLAAIFLLVVAFSGRAIRPMCESYEKQKKFITDAGHELNTPLATISACNEVLAMQQGENQWTDGIRDQVERLKKLTGELVSLARMDEGAPLTVMKPVPLSEVVTETLRPFALTAQSRGLRLVSRIQPDVTVTGDRRLLEQVVSVLADNAVKYASGEEIRFALETKGKKAVLTCENEAEGLTAGDQEAMFDRFRRGDSSRSTEGYGIGLSMAKSIVQMHRGKITAHSPDGKTLKITVQI